MKALLLLLLSFNTYALDMAAGEADASSSFTETTADSFRPTLKFSVGLGFTRLNWGKELQDDPARFALATYVDQSRFSFSYSQSDLGNYIGPGTDSTLHMSKVSYGYGFPMAMEGMSLMPYISYLRFEANSRGRLDSSDRERVDTIDELEARSGFYPGLAVIQEVSKDVRLTFEGELGLFFSGQVGFLF